VHWSYNVLHQCRFFRNNACSKILYKYAACIQSTTYHKIKLKFTWRIQQTLSSFQSYKITPSVLLVWNNFIIRNSCTMQYVLLVHSQNGDKQKRPNPKLRQEMVGLCEAFKQLFRAYNTWLLQCRVILDTFLVIDEKTSPQNKKKRWKRTKTWQKI